MNYSEFSPTGFDSKGLALPDRQDWVVCPTMRNRDSDILNESNFAAALRILGGESDTVEVHRFGHWGPGWYEIILVHPDRTAEVDDIEAGLENCPALDQDDVSEREYQDYIDSWDSFGWRDFVRELAREFRLSFEAEAVLDDASTDKLLELYENAIPDGDCYDSGHGFRCDTALRNISRSELAAFIRANRTRKVAA